MVDARSIILDQVFAENIPVKMMVNQSILLKELNMKRFNISIRSDSIVNVYIDDKQYIYYCDNIARIEYLKNKLWKNPGKLFNEIKQISKEVYCDSKNDDRIARIREESLCEAISS